MHYSPNKTHFMVEISPHFDALSSTKDNESLYINLGFWLALKVFGVMFSKTFFFYSCGLCFWGA